MARRPDSHRRSPNPVCFLTGLRLRSVLTSAPLPAESQRVVPGVGLSLLISEMGITREASPGRGPCAGLGNMGSFWASSSPFEGLVLCTLGTPRQLGWGQQAWGG